jgi:chromosome partitioning protein
VIVVVVTLLNQKGGVGKTSCTHHLSGALAASGRRVLVVDADPQASLTQGWWGPEGLSAFDPAETVAGILDGSLPSPSRLVRPTGLDGLSIVPGSEAAASFNTPDPHSAPRESRESIREFLAEVADDFDVTLIDCPPNLYLCSFAALAASDFMVVPVEPEDYGAQGIAAVQRSLEMVRAYGYPVRHLGYLLTRVQARRALHQVYEANLRTAYGAQVFEARFPNLPDYPESIAARMTIGQYKPKGAAAKHVRAIAEELMARIAAAEQGGSTEGVAA